MRSMQEKDIAEAIRKVKKIADGSSVASVVGNFVAKQNKSSKWVVEFTFHKTDGYKLRARRGEVRQFLRLNGVQKWMEKIGVKEFTVVL